MIKFPLQRLRLGSTLEVNYTRETFSIKIQSHFVTLLQEGLIQWGSYVLHVHTIYGPQRTQYTNLKTKIRIYTCKSEETLHVHDNTSILVPSIYPSHILVIIYNGLWTIYVYYTTIYSLPCDGCCVTRIMA